MSETQPIQPSQTRESRPGEDTKEDDPSATSSAGPSRTHRPLRARGREFYSIGEVCEMVGLKPHVLRYWETQFEALSPAKNRAGNRVYRARDVEMISLIHRLVHQERYTIKGARERLKDMQEEGTLELNSARALERSFLRSLRGDLERLLTLLDPDSG